MPSINHPNCRCILEREVAPRNFARVLQCWGGPEDGMWRVLHADETELIDADGRYVLVASVSREFLRWRASATNPRTMTD